MTPPLCIGCHQHYCKRRHGTAPCKRGDRMIDGKRWGWFCCRFCARRALGQSAYQSDRYVAAVQARQDEHARKALAEIVALCKGLMDENGKVEAKAMVKVFMQQRRRWKLTGYRNGFLMAERRYRRAA